MKSDLQTWQGWASLLQRWAINGWVVSLLEISNPFDFLGAQMIFFMEPLLKPFIPQRQLQALVDLLEDPEKKDAFISYLKNLP